MCSAHRAENFGLPRFQTLKNTGERRVCDTDGEELLQKVSFLQVSFTTNYGVTTDSKKNYMPTGITGKTSF